MQMYRGREAQLSAVAGSDKLCNGTRNGNKDGITPCSEDKGLQNGMSLPVYVVVHVLSALLYGEVPTNCRYDDTGVSSGLGPTAQEGHSK